MEELSSLNFFVPLAVGYHNFAHKVSRRNISRSGRRRSFRGINQPSCSRVILFPSADNNFGEYYFTLNFPAPNYATMESDRQEEYDKFPVHVDYVSIMII